jgi:outer membrane protein OmpA-like peptidoglycan-associated protein/tetratricopeptide (TPR) repeat protein
MTIKKYILSIILSIFAAQMYSQETSVAIATKDYDKLAYVDAIKVYERVAEKGYKDEGMFRKLANSYYFNADLLKANKWYGELFKLNKDQDSEYYFRYANTLKAAGDYMASDAMLETFNKLSGNDKIAKKTQQEYLNDIKLNSGRFLIYNAEVNSKFSDYGAFVYNNKLIFTSARRISGPSKNVFLWTNKYFSNLFQSDINANENLSEPSPFENEINSKFNESSAVFTKDGLTMYFTRNNYLNGKRGSNDDEVTLLKLYKATMQDGKWANVIELPFNSDQYSSAHPALSPDEKTLYFASNMPGTLGESDLFKVSINDDGTFGKPKNLGGSINTKGRETFPFITEKNELYFSSDGHLGLGGLDVFVTSLKSLSDVQNVGEPVNSPQDDFAFYINNQTSKGFFSSNREGGLGEDDIYKLTEIRTLNNTNTFSGFIKDSDNKQIIPNAKISIFNNNFKLIDSLDADLNGFYNINLEANKIFYVRYAKEGFETKEAAVATSDSQPIDMPIYLEKVFKPVGVGTDLAKTANISSIYFDKDKWTIKKDSEFELQKIVEIMTKNKELSIEIRSYTDSRQSKDYNFKLSNRIKSKGFGETQLVNHCSDGIKCSEDEHKTNRRSEFIVTNLN